MLFTIIALLLFAIITVGLVFLLRRYVIPLYYIVFLMLPIYWLALAIQRLGPTQTAAVGNLGPVLTVLASWAILSEQISLYQVAGMRRLCLPRQQLASFEPDDAAGGGEPSAAHNRPRQLAGQHRKRIFLPRDLGLQLRHKLNGRLILRLGLAQFELAILGQLETGDESRGERRTSPCWIGEARRQEGFQ